MKKWNLSSKYHFQICNVFSYATHDYDLLTALGKLTSGEWDGVVLTNDLTVNYFNYISRSPKRIQYTRDLMRLQNPVFFFRKNSILRNMFNIKIEFCQESGLINHWVAKFKHNKNKNKHKKPKKLGIPNILGIIKISCVMNLFSCIVLSMEILSIANKTVKRFIDFLTY